MSINSKRQAQSSRRSRGTSTKTGVDYEIKARIEALERQLATLGRSGGKESAKVANSFPMCEGCGDIGHMVHECPLQNVVNDEVNVQDERKQYGMNSNTYHLRLRNHPNFRYGNSENQMNPNF
jgi:hypothetical protein